MLERALGIVSESRHYSRTGAHNAHNNHNQFSASYNNNVQQLQEPTYYKSKEVMSREFQDDPSKKVKHSHSGRSH